MPPNGISYDGHLDRASTDDKGYGQKRVVHWQSHLLCHRAVQGHMVRDDKCVRRRHHSVKNVLNPVDFYQVNRLTGGP